MKHFPEGGKHGNGYYQDMRTGQIVDMPPKGESSKIYRGGSLWDDSWPRWKNLAVHFGLFGFIFVFGTLLHFMFEFFLRR